MKETAKEKSAKKPRPERATLASLNRKVDLMDSRLRTLKAWETMQDAMEESRSAPAEEWKPKVGDWANWRGRTECGPHQVEKVGSGKTLEMKDLPFLYDWSEWTPCTPAEIAAHKAKEEQRAKEAEWAKVSELMEGDATAPSSRRSNPSRAWIPVADLKPLCDTTPGSLGIEVEILPKVHIGGFGPESTAFYGRRIDDRGCFYKYGARAYGITHWRALGIGVAATKERVGNPTGAKRSNAKPGASRATPKKNR